ncbi:MAG: cupredoxin domain-containing protein [Sporichthyaceae bacterium]
MPPHVWAVGLSAALLLATAGPAQAKKSPQPKTYEVTQHNLVFDPDVLKIKPGDTVVWTNKESDDSLHSVVQVDGTEINSPDIPPNTTFEVTFTEPFDWRIKCRFHPDMFMDIAVAGKKGDGDGLHAEPSPREEPKAPAGPLPGLPPLGNTGR